MRRTITLPTVLVLSLALAACGAFQPGPSDFDGIRADIQARWGDQLNGIGGGADFVEVDFKSTALDAATAVVAKYGTGVRVRLGLLPFPSPSGAGNGCLGWLQNVVSETQLQATIELPDRSNRIGHGTFNAKVHLTNTGQVRVHVDSGQPLVILLYLRDRVDPVGTLDAAIGGTGLSTDLDPGSSFDIEAIGGTASCDPALGYDLPDGQYIARAVVEQGGGDQPTSFLSEPLTVAVSGGQ